MKKLLVAYFVMVLAILASTANAHVKVVSTAPADGEQVVTSPTNFEINYSKEVRLIKFKLVSEGKEIPLDFKTNFTPATSFDIPLTKLPEGEYKAKWTIMGSDSHKMNKDVTFKVITKN
ncbi:copper resistance CopC family protein [Kangiella sediminilitoris]|uniref:CopC domain-containing protein n=1 Tax=Kangiella sediminilitoris TaxID=1144748 RepID=A0A1B3BAM7_9GAMM|nr:copper resistance CopC family protein [Kangiella sediminilitoris]AOE49852.1 hypothetical protein KS2013_1132 [Kangiella sediminilitoris]